MEKNLVIACDGTNNEFGKEDTNVVRLVRSLDSDATRQLVYYDPGVGTLSEPGRITRVATVLGLMFGAGLSWKVTEAYRFLMQRWRPGDRVFLFGFSRGAYTVRVLAAFLHMFGLLPEGNDNLLPYTMRLFQASRARLKNPDKQGAFWALCEAYRETFARAIPHQSDRRFPVYFVGVWDTVSSVGWVWDPKAYPFTARNAGIVSIRHAISIDERRCFFRQNSFTALDGQDLSELWFPGVHCDVGYPEDDGGLWREPFRWIRDEAVAKGLCLDAARDDQVWTRRPPMPKPWLEPKHESLRGLWWIAEYFPKLVYFPKLKRRLPAFGCGRHRRIPDLAEPHMSTLRRLRGPSGYSPPNIPDRWRSLPADAPGS